MGLIARSIEAAGVPTLCLSSALSITRAVNPPRSVFLDFPLGHTVGKPHDRALQRRIVLEALDGFRSLEEPGSLRVLPYRWSDDDAWKDLVMRVPASGSAEGDARDERLPRLATPQYQCERDRELAEAALAAGGCPTCVFLSEGDR